MKNKLKFIVLSTLVYIMFCAVTASADYTSGAYTYTTSGSNAVITKYDDTQTISGGNLILPDKLGGKTVTEVGEGAFRNCTRIKNLTIPTNIKKIGNFAFSGCYGINSITINATKLSVIGSYAFQGTSIESIDIPTGVQAIGDGAFYSCQLLRTVSISNTVYSIGNEVFKSCFALENIDVSQNNYTYYSIDGVLYNFANTILYTYPPAKSDTEYVLPYSVMEIAPDAFRQTKNLRSITFSEKLTKIGDGAFMYSGIKFADLPQGLAAIGEGAFEGSAVESVNIKGNVSYIGDYAFSRCTNLKNITMAEGLGSIGSYAFQYCPVTQVTIPSTVTSIGGAAFCGTNLEMVEIPQGIAEIKGSTFRNCTSLKSITIPKSVQKIYEYAIYSCTALTDIYYTGTEAEWNLIDIHSLNTLTGVTVHYRHGMKYTETAVGENGFLVKPVLIPDGSSIIVVCYQKGRPVWIREQKYIGTETMSFDFDEAFDKIYDEVKVMAWESLGNIKPLCNAENVSVN